MTDDSKISRRYRSLAREEPPRHVDEAILAAARRAAEARPAPLVVPSGRRRWYFPLAAAAVIVLAVAVTVHVERQQRDVELAEAPVAASPPPREGQAAVAQAPAKAPAATPPVSGVKRELYVPDPKPAPSEEQPAPHADLQKAPLAAPESPTRQDAERGMRESERKEARAAPQLRDEVQPAPGPAPQAKPSAPMPQESRIRAARAPDAAPAAAGALSTFAYASPEQWLQGIADLRRQGRHEEADKALAEFRRAYPNYRISEAMLEKVEKK